MMRGRVSNRQWTLVRAPGVKGSGQAYHGAVKDFAALQLVVWCVKTNTRIRHQQFPALRFALQISHPCAPFLCAFRVAPEVTIDGSKVLVHHTDEKEPHPLALHHVPICVTFAIFEVRHFVAEVLWRNEKSNLFVVFKKETTQS